MITPEKWYNPVAYDTIQQTLPEPSKMAKLGTTISDECYTENLFFYLCLL